MNLTTLEQSKKLKELEAPQTTLWYWRKVSGDHFILSMKADETISMWTEHYAAYDLESLIEWLGKDFRNLEKWTEGKEYVARSIDRESQIPEPAATLLEAVYNLALEVCAKNAQTEGDK